MYKLKENIDKEILRKYGFRKGFEYPEYDKVICNNYEYDDFWLFSLDDDEEKIDRDGNQELWSIHIQPSGRMWIEASPFGTYHIDNDDMEKCIILLD